jgi:hypothetical protein
VSVLGDSSALGLRELPGHEADFDRELRKSDKVPKEGSDLMRTGMVAECVTEKHTIG